MWWWSRCGRKWEAQGRIDSSALLNYLCTSSTCHLGKSWQTICIYYHYSLSLLLKVKCKTHFKIGTWIGLELNIHFLSCTITVVVNNIYFPPYIFNHLQWLSLASFQTRNSPLPSPLLLILSRDSKIAHLLLQAQYPVLGVDCYMPVVDVFSGSCKGNLRVALAMGRSEQILDLQRMRDEGNNSLCHLVRPVHLLDHRPHSQPKVG